MRLRSNRLANLPGDRETEPRLADGGARSSWLALWPETTTASRIARPCGLAGMRALLQSRHARVEPVAAFALASTPRCGCASSREALAAFARAGTTARPRSLPSGGGNHAGVCARLARLVGPFHVGSVRTNPVWECRRRCRTIGPASTGAHAAPHG